VNNNNLETTFHLSEYLSVQSRHVLGQTPAGELNSIDELAASHPDSGQGRQSAALNGDLPDLVRGSQDSVETLMLQQQQQPILDQKAVRSERGRSAAN
jgi:hypothetical protein